MSLHLLITVLALVFGLSILMLVFNFLAGMSVLWNAPNLRPRDVSHAQQRPPASIQPIIDDLAKLGFTRLGEASRLSPAQGADSAQVWYSVDTDKTTCAGIFYAATRGNAVIYSWFGDDAVVVTAFPDGITINDHDFRFQPISASVEAAYHHHVEQLPDFKMRYGPPRKLDTMAEVLRLDAVYNTRFAKRRLQPSIRRDLVQGIAAVYISGLLLAVAVGIMQYGLPAVETIGVALALGLPVLAWTAWRRRRQRRG